jgi:hypothetical protein
MISSILSQLRLVVDKYFQEGGSDLQIWSFGVDKLQCFIQSPVVLMYEIQHANSESPGGSSFGAKDDAIAGGVMLVNGLCESYGFLLIDSLDKSTFLVYP